MTPLLIGLAIGLIASIGGYRIRRTIASGQLNDEDDPRFVDVALDGPNNVIVIPMAHILEDLDFAIWQTELTGES